MANEYCGPQNVTEIPVSDYLNRCWDTNDDGESSSSSLSDLFERAFLDTLQQLKNDNKQIENALEYCNKYATGKTI
jgi:hypothetical protein